MKKKIIILISIVLIILTIITVIYVIKNKGNHTIKTTGNIDEKTFHKLRDFEIVDEETMQIIEYGDPGMVDASYITYYNFEFDKKIVVSLSNWTYYMPGSQGESFNKYEYQLTDGNTISRSYKGQKSLVELQNAFADIPEIRSAIDNS